MLGGVVVVPGEAAKPCTPAPLPAVVHPSLGDYRVFGVLQTGRLEVCEERRALAVEAMLVHNAGQERLAEKLRPKAWWHFW